MQLRLGFLVNGGENEVSMPFGVDTVNGLKSEDTRWPRIHPNHRLLGAFDSQVPGNFLDPIAFLCPWK